MKKILAVILALMLTLALCGCGSQKTASVGKDGKVHIVTSFYPMYIDVINITKGVDGVEVTNLTEPQTGCLHDYQLTTENIKTLEKADIFVVNGAGMELFLEKAANAQPNLKIIDASKSEDITLLKDHGEGNPHLWLSVTYAIEQVKAINRQLCDLDPAHADAYKKNTLDYINKLTELRSEMHAGLDDLPHKDIVTFHEAFPYLAKEFDLRIVSVIEREPGTEPTPEELEQTIDQVKALPVKVLFTEPQYSPAAAETIARETGAKIYTLDPIVTGESTPDAADDYINKMKQNMATLKQALQ